VSTCKGAPSCERRYTQHSTASGQESATGKRAGGRNAALHKEKERATDGAGAGAETQAVASGAVTATRTAAGKPVSCMRTGSHTLNTNGAAPSHAPGRALPVPKSRGEHRVI